MKSFDFIFEEILTPACETLVELGEFLLEILLYTVFLITVPIWLIPYLIIKNKKGSKDET